MDDENLLVRFINQLDTLIPFIALSHQDVFELVQREKYIWFVESQRRSVPETYDIYHTQVNHSAFLLGYSYFEVFLGDLVRKIFVGRQCIVDTVNVKDTVIAS